MPLSNIHILYQDAAVLVVNKPTLLLSVPGRADDNKDCLITRLQENGYPEARIVHRLDWETSGIILLARDADTHRELSRQFHDRETEKAYTALGDSVNLSSRLEGLNKDYSTHILVNETTYAAAKDSGFVFRELDLIRVKGKNEPVVIYELVCDAKSLTPEIEMLQDSFADARKLYEERRWTEAQSAFQSIIDRWPDDGPARAYWKRCQEYLFDEPPANWDGVFTMTHK